MNRTPDVEKELKQRLKELAPDDMACSAQEAQLMLDRLDDYRKRLQEQRHKWDKAMSPTLKELHEHRFMREWARKRLEKGCHYSSLDIYEVAELIAMIEKKVGYVKASRLLSGYRLAEDYADETIGVLKAAIEAAREEKDKYYQYMRENVWKQSQKKG